MSLHGRKRTASGGESLTTTPVLTAIAMAASQPSAPASIPDLSLAGDPAHPSCFYGMTAPGTTAPASIPPVIKTLVWKRYVVSEAGICYCCRSAGITPATFECAYLATEAGPRIENLRPVCGGCANAVASGSLTAFIEKYGLHK